MYPAHPNPLTVDETTGAILWTRQMESELHGDDLYDYCWCLGVSFIVSMQTMPVCMCWMGWESGMDGMEEERKGEQRASPHPARFGISTSDVRRCFGLGEVWFNSNTGTGGSVNDRVMWVELGGTGRWMQIVGMSASVGLGHVHVDEQSISVRRTVGFCGGPV